MRLDFWFMKIRLIFLNSLRISYIINLIKFAFLAFCTPTILIYALPFPKCKKTQFSDIAKLAQKISVVQDDNREIFADYSRRKKISLEETERRFGATGVVYCGGQQGTAQVTGNRLVITTAKHIFFDNNCQPYAGNNCFFALRNDQGNVKKFPIDRSSVRAGPACAINVDRSSDWAVAELTIPVPQPINPYKISEQELAIGTNADLVQISSYSDNFHPEMGKPRYITECKVQDVARDRTIPIQSDCDSGPGASGSAQLIETNPGEFQLAAIQVAHSADSYDSMPYRSDEYYNISVPVNNDFRTAILSAITATNSRLNNGRKPVQASSGF